MSGISLNPEKFKTDLLNLMTILDKTQWHHQFHLDKLQKLPILTRADLQNKKMKKGLYSCSTSGSTGEPVTVEKSYNDYLWYVALNLREIIWKKWNPTLSLAVIKPAADTYEENSWGLPNFVFPLQGKSYITGYRSPDELQKWLEEKNPDYIHCIPSTFKLLDISKLSNFKDWKSTGEVGASMYSSEECGVIAITCPDNPEVYHVMENQIVEADEDGGMIVTTLSNSYIRRYKNGDHIELGTCQCGRKLQTIKKINGRIRNMFTTPDGGKVWPTIGSREYYTDFGIKQFKMMQESLDLLRLQIIAPDLRERESALKEHILKCLGFQVNIIIEYVAEFKNYKHEEFVSLIS